MGLLVKLSSVNSLDGKEDLNGPRLRVEWDRTMVDGEVHFAVGFKEDFEQEYQVWTTINRQTAIELGTMLIQHAMSARNTVVDDSDIGDPYDLGDFSIGGS